MKLSGWYEFNKGVLNFGDMLIEAFSKKSYKTEDRMLFALMKIEDVISMFGDYELMLITKTYKDNNPDNYATIGALLYKEN